jgi:inosose dehydratase
VNASHPAPLTRADREADAGWRVANAPCSWGTIENTGTDDRRVDAATFLDEVAATGYAGTELGDVGFLPAEPERLTAELAERRLALPAGWVTVRLTDPDRRARNVEAALATARLLRSVGGPTALVNLGPDHSRDPVRTSRAGRIRPEDGLDAAGMDAYAAEAHHIARAVRDETGLRSAFHPHGGSFVETPDEIDAFLDRTDPELVDLCFDTGHVALGGGDPVACLRRWRDRVALVHLKDFDPAVVARAETEGWGYPELIRHGVFPELGRGDVRFGAVLDLLRDSDYRGWLVVEQDVLPGLGTPRASAERNRAFLRELGA